MAHRITKLASQLAASRPMSAQSATSALDMYGNEWRCAEGAPPKAGRRRRAAEGGFRKILACLTRLNST